MKGLRLRKWAAGLRLLLVSSDNCRKLCGINSFSLDAIRFQNHPYKSTGGSVSPLSLTSRFPCSDWLQHPFMMFTLQVSGGQHPEAFTVKAVGHDSRIDLHWEPAEDGDHWGTTSTDRRVQTDRS